MIRFRILMIAFLCSFLGYTDACAHPGHSGPEFTVRVGIDGRIKLGQWTQVQLHVDAGDEDFKGTWRVSVADGDGFPVTYTNGTEPFVVSAAEQSLESILVRVGRAPWRLDIEVMQQDTVVYSKSVSVGAGIQAVRATDFWILQVGSETEINPLTLRRLVSENEQITDVFVTSLSDSGQLPVNPRGLDGIDVIVLGTSNKDELELMRTEQLAALVSWVRQGGQIVLSAARNAEHLVTTDNPLSALIPGNIEEIHEQWIATGLENYIKARETIGSLRIPGRTSPMLELTDIVGRVEAMDGVGDTGRIPVLIFSQFGFGKVAFAGVDLDLEPFANWDDSQRLIHQMIAGDESSRINTEVFGDQARGSHSGFDDLSGQLRSELDHFDDVSPIRFSWIATLLILFVLLIGPIDYFVLKRLNRLQLSWITFTVCVTAFSVIALVMHSTLRSSPTAIQQVEVVDYDIPSGQMRGTNWAMLYAPEASAVDVGLVIHDESRPSERVIGWHGLPGTGLGGLSRRSYQKLLDHEYHADPTNGQLNSLPIPHGGTRYLQSRWARQQPSGVRFELKPDRSRIGLQGTIHNPFDFQLRDVLIYYRGRLYPAKTLAPDQVIDLDELAGESISIESYFTRVSVEGGRSRARPWSTSDEGIVRLIQAMMFHEAVGGESYTGLVHRYDGFMDLSHQLTTNRAILFGWSRTDHKSEISITGESHGDIAKKQWSFYRVSFPPLSTDAVAENSNATVLGD